MERVTKLSTNISLWKLDPFKERNVKILESKIYDDTYFDKILRILQKRELLINKTEELDCHLLKCDSYNKAMTTTLDSKEWMLVQMDIRWMVVNMWWNYWMVQYC